MSHFTHLSLAQFPVITNFFHCSTNVALPQFLIFNFNYVFLCRCHYLWCIECPSHTVWWVFLPLLSPLLFSSSSFYTISFNPSHFNSLTLLLWLPPSKTWVIPFGMPLVVSFMSELVPNKYVLKKCMGTRQQCVGSYHDGLNAEWTRNETGVGGAHFTGSQKD